MPSAKDLQWTRSRLTTVVVVAAASLAGFGCTQMPPPVRHVRIYELSAPTSAPVRSVERDVRRIRSVRAMAPDGSSSARRASGARRALPARSTPAAFAGAPAKNGGGPRLGAARILRADQMIPRGPARNRDAMDRPGSGRTRVAVVDDRAPNPDGESPRLVLSGASVDSGSLPEGVGSPVPAARVMNTPESSRSSPESSAERTVVRGGRSGDNVSELTRFVRPVEPRRRSSLDAPLDAPTNFRTLFSNSPVIPLSAPRPFYSSTRCGHGRF